MFNSQSLKMLVGVAALAATVGASAPGQAAPVFSQGFETDTAGWFDGSNGWNGSVTRTTGGIGAFEGNFFAQFTQTNDTGPFTRFDKYRSSFPGTYSARAAIYLDTTWNAGEGFDYSVASSRSDGTHLRDFIFHVTKDTSTGSLLVAGSNNTNFDPREDLETLNHEVIATSGWYIFEHVFRDDGAGVLAVDLNLYDAASLLLFTETRSDPSDTIPGVVGGNRYGWFTNIDIASGISVDATELLVPVPLPAALPLLLTGLGGIGFAGWRRRRKAAAA